MSMPSLPKVLLTGARGKLASQAIPVLQNDYDLYLTDKAPPGESKLPYQQADITEYAGLSKVMTGMDAVAHLAIASLREFDPTYKEDTLLPFDEMTLKVNVQGTYHIFEAARRAGVKKIVYLSSFTAHLGNKHRPFYDKDTPLDPRNLYACTKIFGENLARLYHREHGMSVIGLRIGQPYPSGTVDDQGWQTNKRARSVFVTMEDISLAIRCALKTDVPYGIYNIVSASDNPRIDLEHAREIGYVPRGFFSENNLSFYENGDFPKVSGEIVVD